MDFSCWIRIWGPITSRFRKKGVETPKNSVFGHFWKIVKLNADMLQTSLISEIKGWTMPFQTSPKPNWSHAPLEQGMCLCLGVQEKNVHGTNFNLLTPTAIHNEKCSGLKCFKGRWLRIYSQILKIKNGGANIYYSNTCIYWIPPKFVFSTKNPFGNTRCHLIRKTHAGQCYLYILLFIIKL